MPEELNINHCFALVKNSPYVPFSTVISEKTGIAIVAALNDMGWYIW
jgi:hypothetical protein